VAARVIRQAAEGAVEGDGGEIGAAVGADAIELGGEQGARLLERAELVEIEALTSSWAGPGSLLCPGVLHVVNSSDHEVGSDLDLQGAVSRAAGGRRTHGQAAAGHQAREAARSPHGCGPQPVLVTSDARIIDSKLVPTIW
jgi:hypothetical protein